MSDGAAVADATPLTSDVVRAAVRGEVGVITLNRPRPFNALTTEMVEAIDAALCAWERKDLRAIVLHSASPKAFCAGGDIRAIREHSLAADDAASERFFATEYRLNERIATHPVPIVSLIDGICMGGGMGLSIHGTFRLVTDKAVFSMPETSIGFFPDVGASYFLSRLPGSLGTYLGLTGARLSASDALYSGLATHAIGSGALEPALDALNDRAATRSVDEALRTLEKRLPTTGDLCAHRDEIDWCFGASTVEEIHARLSEVGGSWAHATQATLQRASPQSLHVTLDLLTWGRQRTLAECLDVELDTARRITRTADFVEGVRAMLVDKDQHPVWSESRYAGTTIGGRPTWRS
jgi:enoyl-CoA hydratase/carnithine racemase